MTTSKNTPVGGGKAVVATVTVECPVCGGACAEKYGSQTIEWPITAEYVVCCDCGQLVKSPKTVTK